MTVAETLVAGRYRIGPCLGAGGMGRVWLARDEVLRRDVAIKEIALPFGLTDEEREEMRARTLREARAAARLSHPNVVRIYDVQHGDERPWIVMEYIPSRSLQQVIKENGPLPPKEAAGIGLAVLSALEAADRVGVVHRDVKPSNVLIADDGRVLLTDFGAAMIDEGEGALTQTGIILGSPALHLAGAGRDRRLHAGVRPLVAGRDAVRGGRGPRAVHPRDDAGDAGRAGHREARPGPAGRAAQAGAQRPAAEEPQGPDAAVRGRGAAAADRRRAERRPAAQRAGAAHRRRDERGGGPDHAGRGRGPAGRARAAGRAGLGRPNGADSLPLSSPAVVPPPPAVSGSAVASRSAPVPIPPAAAPASGPPRNPPGFRGTGADGEWSRSAWPPRRR